MNHGMHKFPEYFIWIGMKSRCYNPKRHNYKYYGGRGIVIDSSWANDFEQFYKDMGPRPTKAHKIERLNNDKNYSPANCVWKLHKDQIRNQSTNKLFTFLGKTQCLAAWCEEFSINYKSVWHRIMKLDWPFEEALTTPIRKINATTKS